MARKLKTVIEEIHEVEDGLVFTHALTYRGSRLARATRAEDIEMEQFGWEHRLRTPEEEAQDSEAEHRAYARAVRGMR
jgi:hypothetical protein